RQIFNIRGADPQLALGAVVTYPSQRPAIAAHSFPPSPPTCLPGPFHWARKPDPCEKSTRKRRWETEMGNGDGCGTEPSLHGASAEVLHWRAGSPLGAAVWHVPIAGPRPRRRPVTSLGDNDLLA